MKLKTIKIENFKSIQSVNLHFTDSLYCLIGKNEIGKSNILHAIASLGYQKIYETDDEIKKVNKILAKANIEAVFDLSLLANAIKQLLILIKPKNSPHAEIQRADALKYRVENVKSIGVIAKKNLSANNTFFVEFNDSSRVSSDSIEDTSKKDQFIQILHKELPDIQYYNREDFLIKPVKVIDVLQNSEDASMQSFMRLLTLGGLDNLERLISAEHDEIIEIKDAVAAKVNMLLRKYYKQELSINIRIESHNEKFSLHFRDDYNRLNSLEDRSTGFQYFFAFLINKIYLKEIGKKNLIYLFDEPALSLHPTGQKDFIKLLEEIALQNLVLYTTHSPFSINRMRPTRVWVIERSVAQGTHVNHKPYLKNWRPLRSSLGIDVSDSFFYAEKSLLVEGPEDRIYIGALLNYFSSVGKIDMNSDLLSIIDSGSISNMPAMIQILHEEKRPMVILMDDDDKTAFKRVKAKESNINDPDILSVYKISDISNDAISIEDLMPGELYYSAVENYLKLLIADKSIVFIEPNNTIPDFTIIKPPKKYEHVARNIIGSFQNPDKSLLDKKTPISKVGIAHEFEKLLTPATKLQIEEEKRCMDLITLIIEKLKL
jgi:predicted ATP-dependent endonuclease of OLD family